MSKKYMVFGATKTKACLKLGEKLNDMRYGDVREVKESKSDMLVKLVNGDTYEVAVASDVSLGRRCDVAYVDKDIKVDVLDNVIMPCLNNRSEIEDNIIFW